MLAWFPRFLVVFVWAKFFPYIDLGMLVSSFFWSFMMMIYDHKLNYPYWFHLVSAGIAALVAGFIWFVYTETFFVSDFIFSFIGYAIGLGVLRLILKKIS